MTPQGHPESGWVNFSSFIENGNTICQIRGLARANDPIYEIAFRLAGSKAQEKIWRFVLTALAIRLGVEPYVSVEKKCIDTKVQWSQCWNIWYNAQMRTSLYLVCMPIRRLYSIIKRCDLFSK